MLSLNILSKETSEVKFPIVNKCQNHVETPRHLYGSIFLYLSSYLPSPPSVPSWADVTKCSKCLDWIKATHSICLHQQFYHRIRLYVHAKRNGSGRLERGDVRGSLTMTDSVVVRGIGHWGGDLEDT